MLFHFLFGYLVNNDMVVWIAILSKNSVLMSFCLLTNTGNKYIDRLLKCPEKKNGMKKNETENPGRRKYSLKCKC